MVDEERRDVDASGPQPSTNSSLAVAEAEGKVSPAAGEELAAAEGASVDDESSDATEDNGDEENVEAPNTPVPTKETAQAAGTPVADGGASLGDAADAVASPSAPATAIEGRASELCSWEERRARFQQEYDELLATELKRFELRGNADTERELAAFHAAAPGIEEDKFPDSFLPLLAKLCQDSPQPLTPLAKAVYKALLPDDLECNLSLITINDAIQLACERKYYGVKPQRGVTTAEDASANAHWLWEANAIEFLPAGVRAELKHFRRLRKLDRSRVAAYGRFFALAGKKRPDQGKLSKAAERIIKCNRDASKVRQKYLLKKREREAKSGAKRKQSSVKKNPAAQGSGQPKAKKSSPDKSAEKKKRQRIKEAAAAAKKRERERVRKERELKKEQEKKAREAAKKAKDRAKEEARKAKEVEKMAKEAARLEARRKKEEAKRAKEEAKRRKLEEEERMQKRKTQVLKKQSNKFSSFFKKISKKKPALSAENSSKRFHPWETPADTSMAPVLAYRTPLAATELDTMVDSVSQPITRVELRRPARRRRNKRPFDRKLLQFFEDVRPPWFGRHRLTGSRAVHGRRPFGRDAQLDYDYDSEAEWVDEGDGEDLRSDEDDDDDDDGTEKGPSGVRKDGLEEDGFLIAEDDPDFDGGLCGEGGGAGTKARVYGPAFNEASMSGDAADFLKRFKAEPLVQLPLRTRYVEPPPVLVTPAKKAKKAKKTGKACQKAASPKNAGKLATPAKGAAAGKPGSQTATSTKKPNAGTSAHFSVEELQRIAVLAKEYTHENGRVQWKALFDKHKFPGRSNTAIQRQHRKLKKRKRQESGTASPAAADAKAKPTKRHPAQTEAQPGSAKKRKKEVKTVHPTAATPKLAPEKSAGDATTATAAAGPTPSSSTKTPTPTNRKRKTPPDTKGKTTKRPAKKSATGGRPAKTSRNTIKALFSRQFQKKEKDPCAQGSPSATQPTQLTQPTQPTQPTAT